MEESLDKLDVIPAPH